MTRLECEILNIINETIGGKYLGKLKVTKDDNIYCLDLYLNHTQSPALSLVKECRDENDFKSFVKNEIKTRKLEETSYWFINVEYPGKRDLVSKKKDSLRL